jgi:hypothetical protein
MEQIGTDLAIKPWPIFLKKLGISNVSLNLARLHDVTSSKNLEPCWKPPSDPLTARRGLASFFPFFFLHPSRKVMKMSAVGYAEKDLFKCKWSNLPSKASITQIVWRLNA